MQSAQLDGGKLEKNLKSVECKFYAKLLQLKHVCGKIILGDCMGKLCVEQYNYGMAEMAEVAYIVR